MVKKGRGNSRNIKNGLKADILFVKTNHNDWSANRIREYLLKHRARFNLENTDIPVARTIYNVIQRNQPSLTKMQAVVNSDTFKELEAPWHLGLMRKYDIPPETMPYILIVQGWLDNCPDEFNHPPPQDPLTIREALWVTRLCGIIDEREVKKPKYVPSIAKFLFKWAKAYATHEAICEFSGVAPDTTELDKGLRELGYPITRGKTTMIHYPDQSFSLYTQDEKLLQQMEQMKKDGEAK